MRVPSPPPILADQMTTALDDLDTALVAKDRGDVARAAINIELATLDLELQYDSVRAVDLDRVESWRELRALDQAAGDSAAAASDRVIIAAIIDRIDG